MGCGSSIITDDTNLDSEGKKPVVQKGPPVLEVISPRASDELAEEEAAKAEVSEKDDTFEVDKAKAQPPTAKATTIQFDDRELKKNFIEQILRLLLVSEMRILIAKWNRNYFFKFIRNSKISFLRSTAIKIEELHMERAGDDPKVSNRRATGKTNLLTTCIQNVQNRIQIHVFSLHIIQFRSTIKLIFKKSNSF